MAHDRDFKRLIDDSTHRIADLEARLREKEALCDGLRRQTESLSRSLRALMSDADFGTMVGQVLCAAGEALDAPFTGLWHRDVEDDSAGLSLLCRDGQVVAVRDEEHPRGNPFRDVEQEMWQRIRHSHAPVTITDGEVDNGGALKAAIGVPLERGDELIGWIGAGYEAPRKFHARERDLAAALALPAALAIQMAALAEQSRTAAVLAERNRMAREIHDTLAQGFTGIVIQLDVAELLLDQDPSECAAHLTAAREQARASLSEARRSVWALRPSALEHAGLAAALESLAHQMAAGSATVVSFEVEGEPVPAPPDIEANLLRIGLESLTNALRHSAAGRIRIHLRYTSRGIRLSVHDDGQGFDVERAGRFGGFGITSMQERAHSIGGELSVRSRPGHGTEVTAAAIFRRPPRGRVPAG